MKDHAAIAANNDEANERTFHNVKRNPLLFLPLCEVVPERLHQLIVIGRVFESILAREMRWKKKLCKNKRYNRHLRQMNIQRNLWGLRGVDMNVILDNIALYGSIRMLVDANDSTIQNRYTNSNLSNGSICK